VAAGPDRLAFDGSAGVEEIAAPSVRIDDVLWTTCMDHFLHAPNTRWKTCARASWPMRRPETGRAGVFIWRAEATANAPWSTKRELEAALIQRGFEVVRPKPSPWPEQVSLFRDADVVVAPTGAALANALFLPAGAKVFEIQPENFMGVWVRALCRFVGVDWHGYFCPAPLKAKTVRFEGAIRTGMKFSWRLPLKDFLGFLDARTGG
jgi:capsular polysaccharide biosynthesis protein